MSNINVEGMSTNLSAMQADLSTTKAATPGPGGAGKPGAPGTPEINNPGGQRGVTMVGRGGPASPGPSGVVLTPGNQTLYIDNPVKAAKGIQTLEKDNSTTSTSDSISDNGEIDYNQTTTTTGLLGGTETTESSEDIYGQSTTTTTLSGPGGNASVSTSSDNPNEATITIGNHSINV